LYKYDKTTPFKAQGAAKLFDILEQRKHVEYVPSGLQEEIIQAVGCGLYQIVIAMDANRVGKTTAAINIARQIFWPDNSEYFNFWPGRSLFREWPYKLKRFRITGTPTNLMDNGALQQAIQEWWPRGRYTQEKAGKHFFSKFSTDTGWEGDALTYEQSPAEYEGQGLSLVISDEPPKPSLIGSINSRIVEGVWLIGMTPLNCGVFLDTIDDLQDKGKAVKVLTGSIYENDSETGKPNHNGTKKGLWSTQTIKTYIAGIPLDEQDARVRGIASHKSGKIFPMYDDQIHVIDFDLDSLAQCNCYMSIDPHDQYYPFITWHAVTPGSVDVIYNEWPKYEDLGMYYDEARYSIKFSKTMEELANIILANDFSDHGAKILSRCVDPHFHSQVKNDNYLFITKLQERGVMNWQLPSFEEIAIQRINIQSALNWNREVPMIVGANAPVQYVSTICKNTRRALARHYWEEGKDKESEDFKDIIDCIRYRYNLTGGKIYYISTPKINPYDAFMKSLPSHMKTQAEIHNKPKSLAEITLENRPCKNFDKIKV
jgi:hypothetical protein